MHTGHGVQGWWIFREPWVFRDALDRGHAADLAYRFNALFKRRARVHGWDIDSVADLARLMRVPGSTNTKFGGAPCPVFVLQYSDRRYNSSELNEYLDEADVFARLGYVSPVRQASPPKPGWQRLILNPSRTRHWKNFMVYVRTSRDSADLGSIGCRICRTGARPAMTRA